MPSGDAQRTWFSEMVEVLRSQWHEAMSLDELIELTGNLDRVLQAIRKERNITSPMIWCPKCQKREPSAPPRVSVRPTILTLGRYGIASPETVTSWEKRWTKHRKEQHLDLFGCPAVDSGSPHGDDAAK